MYYYYYAILIKDCFNKVEYMGKYRRWVGCITPTISLGSHQNIGLHTGARANVVLLTYLLTY